MDAGPDRLGRVMGRYPGWGVLVRHQFATCISIVRLQKLVGVVRDHQLYLLYGRMEYAAGSGLVRGRDPEPGIKPLVHCDGPRTLPWQDTPRIQHCTKPSAAPIGQHPSPAPTCLFESSTPPLAPIAPCTPPTPSAHWERACRRREVTLRGCVSGVLGEGVRGSERLVREPVRGHEAKFEAEDAWAKALLRTRCVGRRSRECFHAERPSGGAPGWTGPMRVGGNGAAS